MSIENVEQASQIVSSAQTTFGKYLSNEKTHNTSWNDNVRDRRHKMLAELYGVCSSLVESRDVLAALCIQEGVQVPDSKENPFAPAIRLVCRTKDSKGNVKPAATSTWIYSKYFRAAQHLGWTSSNFAKNAEKYEFEKGGKKFKWLKGLALLCDQEFGIGSDAEMDQRIKQAARIWAVKNSIALGSLDNLAGFDDPKAGQMVGLVVQWNVANSKWEVRGLSETDDEKAFGLISKPLIAEFSKWREQKSLELAEAEVEQSRTPYFDESELLEAVAQQNADQLVANDEAERAAAANDQD